jgi:hypothetical protein
MPRDGIGVELIDEHNNVVAEVFRCDADRTLVVRLFESVPFVAVEWLIETARDRLGAFEDGTPLPERLSSEPK